VFEIFSKNSKETMNMTLICNEFIWFENCSSCVFKKSLRNYTIIVGFELAEYVRSNIL
jgi:hypothetical protein